MAASHRAGIEVDKIMPLPAKYATQTMDSWFKDPDEFRDWHKNLKEKYKLK